MPGIYFWRGYIKYAIAEVEYQKCILRRDSDALDLSIYRRRLGASEWAKIKFSGCSRRNRVATMDGEFLFSWCVRAPVSACGVGGRRFACMCPMHVVSFQYW